MSKTFLCGAILLVKCYNVTEVLQLQPLSSNGCIICTVVSLNFNFFFIFSQPVENIIYGQALRLLILANLINQSLYFVRPPNCHLWAKLDWGGVATVFDA